MLVTKVYSAFTGFFLTIFFLFLTANPAVADAGCSGPYLDQESRITLHITLNPCPYSTDYSGNVTLAIEAEQDYFNPEWTYLYSLVDSEGYEVFRKETYSNRDKRHLTAVWKNTEDISKPGEWTFVLWVWGKNKTKIIKAQWKFTQQEGNKKKAEPTLSVDYLLQKGKIFNVEILNAIEGASYSIWFDGMKGPATDIIRSNVNGTMSYPARILTNPVETPEVGPAKICMQRGVITFAIRGTCEFSVAVEIVEFDPSTSPKQHKVQSAKQEPKEEKQKFTTSPFPIQQFQCDGDKGLKTALGCIPIQNTNEFAGWFLRWAIGIAGGVAFLLMVWGGFQIMTASGNLEQVQHGRETITSAVAGLIFIIFSVFLLQLIGVQILGIPGL